MKLTDRDRKRLDGVHKDLMFVIEWGWEIFDGKTVLELPGARLTIPKEGGVRTREQQQELVDAGKSWTMNSRHLTGHAFDFIIINGGRVMDPIELYQRVWLACFRPAAIMMNVEVEWGGYWGTRDGPHIQLSKRKYPS